jgi:hypothetical protein
MTKALRPGLLVLGALFSIQMGCQSQSEDLPSGPTLLKQTSVSPQYPPGRQLFGAEAEAIAHPER